MPLFKNNITDYLKKHEINFEYFSHLQDKTITFKCPACDVKFSIKWDSFKSKSNYNCENCKKIADFNNLNLGTLIKLYPLEGTDGRTRLHVDFNCFKLNHLNKKVRLENLLSRKCCPKCNYDIIIWNKNEIKNLISKNDFKLISKLEEPTNANTEIMICDKNNYYYITSPHQLNQNIKNNITLNPFKKNKVKVENIKNWMKLNKPEYEILSDDNILLESKSNTKLRFRYKGDQFPIDVNHEFECAFSKFKSGQQHRLFKERSKGEQKIRKQLEHLGINFESQYPINYKNQNFKFDFAILNDKKQPLYFIEYHGKQHFEPVNHFGGAIAFQKQIIHDKLKKEYADWKKIKLIEIKKETLDKFQTILEDEGKISKINI